MLECVVNVSEGKDPAVIGEIARAGGDHVLDVHSDPHHHRSVLTIGGPETESAVRAVARKTLEMIDISAHSGVHPRMGALDVVPFVPLEADGSPELSEQGIGVAVAARDRFGRWAGEVLELPCFVYGPERSLPELRRQAWVELLPDFGPAAPHPSAGSCAVGARAVLVAYNLWLATPDGTVARRIAAALRSEHVRALGLVVGDLAQVSCNLVHPLAYGPERAYDEVSRLASAAGTRIERAELVGLVPRQVVEDVPPGRRSELDLSDERSLEVRLEAHLGS